MSAIDPRHLASLPALPPLSLRWDRVLSAAEAIALKPKTLLHAGPAFHDPRAPSAPVLSSALVCALYEGWAEDEAQARQMIEQGTIRLLPSLAYGVSIPLAGVVSPSTALVGVYDQQSKTRYWSMLHSGPGPEVRFGTRNPALQARFAYRDTQLAPALAALLERSPVELLPIAAQALQAGDDLHADTSVATELIRRQLGSQDPGVQRYFEQTPLFFLTLWMASALHLAQRLARLACEPDRILAVAGNGEAVGIRCAGAPDRWQILPAEPPAGDFIGDAMPVSPGIGDSGVIDALGFGAQRWPQGARVVASMRHPLCRGRVSIDDCATVRLVLDDGCEIGSGFRMAVLAATGKTLGVSLAMVERSGRFGLLGRGLVELKVPAGGG